MTKVEKSKKNIETRRSRVITKVKLKRVSKFRDTIITRSKSRKMTEQSAASSEWIKKVECLKLDGNLAESWRVFKLTFDVFATAIELEKKKDEIKIAIFLNSLGTEAIELFHTLELRDEDKKKYDKVVKAFEDFCKPQTNEVYQSFLFHSRNQLQEEPFDTFFLEAKKLARTCGFGTMENRMIRDRIVLGVADKKLQKRLLETENLTWDLAVNAARAAEASNKQIKEMNKKETESAVDSLTTRQKGERERAQTPSNRPDDNKRTGERGTNRVCIYCGLTHPPRKCPAYGKKCNNCDKPNHYAAVCKTKAVRELKYADDSTLYIDSLEHMEHGKWMQTIRIDDLLIDFKIDTGSDINVLPWRHAKKLKNTKIEECHKKIEAYDAKILKPIGKCEKVCMVKNQVVPLQFVIIDTNSNPILGRTSSEALKLVQRIQTLKAHTAPTSFEDGDKLVEAYSENFEGLGCFAEDIKLELMDPNKCCVKPARRIPLSIRAAVQEQLIQMENRGIIAKMNNATDWVSNITAVEKKQTKKLRLCIDPQELNKNLKEEMFLIPTISEITAALSGKKFFTVLDLKDGYWQVKLSEEASRLCTFSTPFGNYRFLRMPFGIKTAAQIFQKHNEKNFGDIKGVAVYIDDLLIAADTEQEHDKILVQVMERAKEKNVKFNEQKIQFKMQKVHYLGHVMSEQGIACDAERLKAIDSIGPPQNKTDLQKLLCMINYLRDFIHNLAEMTQPLRELLKKNIVFQWNAEHTVCLEKIKQCIAMAPTLKAFNELEPVTIETDASQHGLGCCLMQVGRPVWFASRALTPAEQNYAQIEKEMLAIVFACTKFHLFIYGRNTIIRTDHQPLLGIMKKELGAIPSTRLQRMKIRLMKYSIDLKHVPGKEMYISDLLSRYHETKCGPTEIEDMNEMVHTLNVSEKYQAKITAETSTDEALSVLMKTMKVGWPQDKRALKEPVKPYFKLRNELYAENGLIFLNNRVIIPQNLQKEMLRKMHEAHLGIEKTKARARTLMYWLKINEDIEQMITSCKICQKFRSSNVKEPMISHQVPNIPFHTLGMDYCESAGKNFLVVSDYFSRFIEIIPTNRKTASETIVKLQNIFATHGIPRKIVADNVPFGSFEFRQFCSELDIDLETSSPRYPQSNGFAEKAVAIAKHLIQKSKEGNGQLWKAVLEYRNTPIKDTGLSPAEMLMNRMTRTTLPQRMETFETKKNDQIKAGIESQRLKVKETYDKTAMHKAEFHKGDKIWWQNDENKWFPGIIAEKHHTPRSYWIELQNNTKIRRNSIKIRSRSEV